MKVRLITILVITPLLLSLQLQTSHAVDKVGAKCIKVGSKSVVGKTTLSCIKSGDKLVWTKLTDPTPTPSPTFTCPDGSCGNPNISVPLNPSEISKLKKEIEALQKEIEALKAKYNQTKDAKEKDSINSKITELKKKLEILQGEDEVKGGVESENDDDFATRQIVSLINSIDKEEQSVISINASIKKLQAEYKATKTTKGKKAINANIAKLRKQKDIITKKITELTIELKQAKTKIILNEQSD